MSELNASQLTALSDLFVSLCPNIALALSEQFNLAVEIDSPVVETIPLQNLLNRTDRALFTNFSLNQPLPVESLFFLSEECACLVTDIIEGKDGTAPPDTLTEDQVTRLSDAMSGLSRALAIALTNRTGEMIEMETSATMLGALALPPVFAGESQCVQIKATLSVPGIPSDSIVFLFTPEFVQTILQLLEADSAPVGGASVADGILSEEELAGMLGSLGLPQDGFGTPDLPPVGASGAAPIPVTGGLPFANFASNEAHVPRGIELILDIPLDVTVELGRIQMLIRDVLDLSSGSIIELDRVAGEPVDLLVNGRLIAKGEVVVIEDNFGIRITEIISPADRVVGLANAR